MEKAEESHKVGKTSEDKVKTGAKLNSEKKDGLSHGCV
jgi:hypothetical protein